jgi:hypothetical protein
VTGATVVTFTVTNASAGTVYCGTGKRVLGGGISGSSNSSRQSYPSTATVNSETAATAATNGAAGTSWTVSVSSSDNFIVYAICAS